MSTFKLYQQVVQKTSFKDADDHVSFYENKTPHHACFLINQIFTEEQRKVKKQITSSRKHQ